MSAAIAAEIARRWAGVQGDEVVSVTRLSTTAFRVALAVFPENIVLKVYPGHRPQAPDYEARAMTVVSRHDVGIPVPSPLKRGWCANHAVGYLVTSFLPAITAQEWARREEHDRSRVMRLLGHALARMHRATRPAFGWMDREPVLTEGELGGRCCAMQVELVCRHARDLLPATAPLLTRGSGLLDDSRQAVLCHGDVHGCNVLVGDYRVRRAPRISGLVDFEATSWAFPELDVAKTLVVADALDPVGRALVLAGYADAGGHADALRRELIDVMVAYHAIDGWIHAAVLEGRDRSLWRRRLDAAL